jgi:hypothetical protein
VRTPASGRPRPRGRRWSTPPTSATCAASTPSACTSCSPQDDPHYPNWDQDATAVQDRYGEQDPATVAKELTEAAHHLADRFTEVTDWHRTGTRSDGAHFTIDTFARYFIHDPIHHLHDARRAAPTEP